MAPDSSASASGEQPDGVIHRYGSIGDRADDAPIERLRHRLLVYMGSLMSVGALAWICLAAAFGMRAGMMVPIAYLALTAVNFVLFAKTKRFVEATHVQVMASVLLPFVFQWMVGGFAASGAAMLWALVAVVGSLTFASAAYMRRWLFAYVALAIASGLIDHDVHDRFAPPLSEVTKSTFLVGNLVAISLVVLGLVFYFLSERERAEKALAAAKARIADLKKEIYDAIQLGQYTLEEQIGSGGMGAVYRARHAMLRRPTALKLVHSDVADEATLARFEREVQLTATLTHPNIVTIFDYGRTEDGTFYYVMELLDGADLGYVVQLDGPLGAPRALHILAQVAAALAEAHKRGLVHRDIKPANVILTNTYEPDVVKVVDFGLVKEVATPEAGEGHRSLSREGSLVGTPAYMSPEAISRPHEIDGRSDVYSFGCLSYFLLAGRDVFEGTGVMELCSHHMRTPPLPPSMRGGSDVPMALENLVMHCLAKAPEARATMAEIASELQAMRSEPWAAWDPASASEWWMQSTPKLKALRNVSAVSEGKTLRARAPTTTGGRRKVVVPAA